MKYTEMEERLDRREKMALKLADLLNTKIDECEALKEEVRILREHAQGLNDRLKVEQHSTWKTKAEVMTGIPTERTNESVA
jgi:hypothetical protein